MKNLNQIESLKNIKLLDNDQLLNIKGGGGEDGEGTGTGDITILGGSGDPMEGFPFGGR